jgi:hypothetical protein
MYQHLPHSKHQAVERRRFLAGCGRKWPPEPLQIRVVAGFAEVIEREEILVAEGRFEPASVPERAESL